ncbi:MAG TPA: AbrB family transcriptional regulator [Burkholderiales bacterium]
MKAARDSWVNPALALMMCAAAGALFSWLKTPLPWMLGPLLAMAACNFAGSELRAVAGGREAGQVVIGTALGLYFTPVVAREVTNYWVLLIVAALFAILLGVFGGWTLSRIAGTDRTTAFFASVPGGATEMTLQGERLGARPDRVALAQSLRILMVVLLVPFALTYSGVHGSDNYQPVSTPLRWHSLALLLTLSGAAGLVLQRLRVPNAFMFGPLAVVIPLTVAQLEFSSVPTGLSSAAQVLLGCALGARFERQSLASAPRYVVGVLGAVVVAIALSAGFAALLATLSGIPWPTMVLALAPGGIAEMCITAKVLQLGVPLVTAAHVVRVIILITTTGPSFRVARRLRERLKSV